MTSLLPRAYFIHTCHVPYRLTVVRQYHRYRVYRTNPPRRGHYNRDYGQYIPRPYVRRIIY
jgi:hypothetical protein